MKEFKVIINGNEYSINVTNIEGNVATVAVNDTDYTVEMEQTTARPVTINRPAAAITPVAPSNLTTDTTAPAKGTVKLAASPISGGAVKSPLPGVILDICVKEGDEVKTGQKVIVLEAMKMENNINADRDGKIIAIKTNKGDTVLEGEDLLIIG